jgi:hypothetical protein
MYKTSVKLRIKKEQYLVAHSLLEQIYTKVMQSKREPGLYDMILAEFAEKKIGANAYRMWQDRPMNKFYVWQLPTSVAYGLKMELGKINEDMLFDDPVKIPLMGLGSKISRALQ